MKRQLWNVIFCGIMFFIMSITKLRSWMISSIPLNLRIAMGAGVGLFIGLIGLKSGGIIISNDATLLALGDFKKIETLLACLGFLIIAAFSLRKIPGSIIMGILTITLISLLIGLIEFNGLIAYPPDISPTLLKLDILGALNIGMITVIMSFLFVNLFDTTGTLVGVATRANLLDENGEAKGLDKALKALVVTVGVCLWCDTFFCGFLGDFVAVLVCVFLCMNSSRLHI